MDGILYLASPDTEWFSGSVCLSFTFTKNSGAKDMCERVAASLELPIDPLDEEDRDTKKVTYENLNFRFGIKFDPDLYEVVKAGFSARLLPNRTHKKVQFPMPDISGSLAVMAVQVFPNDMNLSVHQYAEKLIKFALDDDMLATEDVALKIAGCEARKVSIRIDKVQEQFTNFFIRHQDRWFLLRWHSLISEEGQDLPKIHQLVESFYFF
eukprot:TRINITY_DN6775_c0_g1_i2.p1 TRINITY_DN6775_c0_g1~~TRINITY_DN6775_c0_g1_i2.p1  ORF type:complete len:210 (+),score=35.79 TRINITY_DN6775_c0_g1_i2:75-704(+)